MITERIGDLLTERDLTHIAHQANLFHAFGAGLARQIALKLPHALLADLGTAYGFKGKLGCFSIGDGKPVVLNLYSQRGAEDGFAECLTDYEALRVALHGVEEFLRDGAPSVRLGLPYRLGCGLAGGSWPHVYGIVEDVLGKSPVEVVIVKLPQEV